MADVEGTPRSNVTRAGPLAPVPPTEGWKLDPFGRYEARRWDGTAWTAEVLHNGYLKDDPTPLADPGQWVAADVVRHDEPRRFDPPPPSAASGPRAAPPPPSWTSPYPYSYRTPKRTRGGSGVRSGVREGLWAVLLIAAALVAVVVVAGGSFHFDSFFTDDDSSDTAAVVTPTGAGTNTARIEAAGITVDYPSTWSVQPITADQSDSTHNFTQSLSNFGELFGGEEPDSDATPTKFLAGLRGSGALMVNTFQDVGEFPATIAEFDALVKPGLQQIGTVLGSSAIQVGNQTAYRVDVTIPFTLPDGTPVAVRDAILVIPFDDGGTFVHVGAVDDPAGVNLIDDVLATVRTV